MQEQEHKEDEQQKRKLKARQKKNLVIIASVIGVGVFLSWLTALWLQMTSPLVVMLAKGLPEVGAGQSQTIQLLCFGEHKQPQPCTTFRLEMNNVIQPTDSGLLHIPASEQREAGHLFRLTGEGERIPYFNIEQQNTESIRNRPEALHLGAWNRHFDLSENAPEKKGGALYPLHGVISGVAPTDVLVCDVEHCLLSQTMIGEMGYQDPAGRRLKPHIGSARIVFESLLTDRMADLGFSKLSLKFVGDISERNVLDILVNGVKVARLDRLHNLTDANKDRLQSAMRGLQHGDVLSLLLYAHRAGRDVVHQHHSVRLKEPSAIVQVLEQQAGLKSQVDLENDILWKKRTSWRELERDTFIANLMLTPDPEVVLSPVAPAQAAYHQQRQEARVRPYRRLMWGIGLMGGVFGLWLLAQAERRERMARELNEDMPEEKKRTKSLLFIGLVAAILLILFILDWTIAPVLQDVKVY